MCVYIYLSFKASQLHNTFIKCVNGDQMAIEYLLTSSAKETGNCVIGLTAMSSIAAFRLKMRYIKIKDAHSSSTRSTSTEENTGETTMSASPNLNPFV